jgi:hypothetical protein
LYMVSIMKQSTLVALSAIVLFGGCSNSSMHSGEEDEPLKWEYNTFLQIPDDCLQQIKDTVGKAYGNEYLYKNTIKSREKPYREAIFSRMEGAYADSTIVVKFDSLCNIKRIFRSLMMIQSE